MIDPRFYEFGTSLTAAEAAQRVGGEVVAGDPQRAILAVAAAGNAGPDDLAFVEGDQSAATDAGVVFTDKTPANPRKAAWVLVKRPRGAFIQTAADLIRLRRLEPGQPAIHPVARLAPDVQIEPGVVIGAGAALGRGVRVGANTVIGPGVQIGAGTTIGRNVSISCALIGDSVTIHSGAVIGETGFGLAADGGGAALSMHFGRVIIQNGCSIGANTCVDRGFLEDTVLGERVHIDNLCHIGHNVRIGSNSVMAAFAGVSGSSVVGDGVEFGGRVGLKDHVTVGQGARIAAGAAVLKDVPAGETWAGYPAKPIRSWMRELAWLASAAQKRQR